jgi:hypothetical protein
MIMAHLPRKLSRVKFTPRRMTKTQLARYPFRPAAILVFLGEVSNMPGHCVVADQHTGRVYAGYHTESLIELRQSET